LALLAIEQEWWMVTGVQAFELGLAIEEQVSVREELAVASAKLIGIIKASSSTEPIAPCIAMHMGYLDTVEHIAEFNECIELAVKHIATVARHIIVHTAVGIAFTEVGLPDFIAVIIRSIADIVAFTSCIIADNTVAIAAYIAVEKFATVLAGP